MSAYLVTGVSGAGKSTLAHELECRGITAIETDADAELACFVDADGAVVERPVAPDFVWLATHRWVWNPTRLVELLERHRDEPLFLCGHADNDTDFLDRYAGVFLLQIDETTMLRRLADPHRGNDFGMVGDTREQVKLWRADFQHRMLALGANPIDASMPLRRVADALLAPHPRCARRLNLTTWCAPATRSCGAWPTPRSGEREVVTALLAHNHHLIRTGQILPTKPSRRFGRLRPRMGPGVRGSGSCR